MKEKGFTLIELLAVVLILGVIVLIVTPSITNIVEESKKESLKVSANSLISAVQQECRNQQIDEEEITNLYEITDNTLSKDLDVKNLPDNGKIIVDDECNIDIAISDNDYCAVKNGERIVVSRNIYDCDVEYTYIPTTTSECFIFDETTHTITGYDFNNASCPKDISIPESINEVSVEHIAAFAFENSDYDYVAYFTTQNGNTFSDIVAENFTSKGLEISSIRYMNKITSNSKKRCYKEDNTSTDVDINYVITENDGYTICSLLTTYVEYSSSIGSITGIDLSKARNLKSIGDAAFMNNKITKVYFGNNSNLVDLGVSIFSNNSIEGTVDLSSLTNLKKIGNAMFSLNNISEIKLHQNLQKIGKNAFSTNGIEIVELSKNVEVIDQYAFMSNPVTNIVFNDSINRIEDGAFYNTNLSGDMIIPDTVTYIGSNCFLNSTEITKLTLGDNLEIIDDYAFYESKINSIIFNSKLKRIGEGTFGSTSLTSLTTPSSLEEIDVGAFASAKINALNLNEGLKNIGEMAFYQNYITKIELPSTIENLGNGCFTANGVMDDSMFITQIRNGIKDDSILISVASRDKDPIEIPSTIKVIETYALYNVVSSSPIIVPDSVTTIKTFALAAINTRGIFVEIGSGIETIESNAFYCNNSWYCAYNLDIDKEKDTITGSPWGNPYMTITWKDSSES